jgi:hypothetical protein
MRPARLALAPLLALACATSPLRISDADQARVRRELANQQRYLRVALYLGPLWSDTTRAFLTDLPAKEIDLVETPTGAPIEPPAFQKVLAPGTPVRVRDVEFPSTFTVAQRVLVTPRLQPWVYLQIQGEDRPCVIVLPREVRSFDDVRAEMERYLSSDDPGPTLASFPPEVREAVLRKEVVNGMSSQALEMAWGVPERKRVDRPASTEEWIWAGGKRRVYLRDDKVEQVDR